MPIKTTLSGTSFSCNLQGHRLLWALVATLVVRFDSRIAEMSALRRYDMLLSNTMQSLTLRIGFPVLRAPRGVVVWSLRSFTETHLPAPPHPPDPQPSPAIPSHPQRTRLTGLVI